MRRLRVLFVNENIGGHVTMHHHLAAVLAARGDVDASFVAVPAPRLTRRLVGAKIPGLARLDADLQPMRAQLAAAATARRLVRNHLADIDAVHWYSKNVALLSADLVRAHPSIVGLDMTNEQNDRRLPYRLPTPLTHPAGTVTRRLERRVYESARLLLAKSAWAAASLTGEYGVNESKVRVHDYGILAGPAPERRPPARPRLLFVGRTLERKGGNELLDLWRDELRERCDLVLVTRAAVTPEPGLEVIGDLEPGDARLDEIMRASTALVFPSTIDASPHVVYEAMAAGLPVVVASSGGMPEQVDDGVTGLVIAPNDRGALATAVEKLLADPQVAEAMGAAGRARLEQRFDTAKTVDQLIDALHEVAARAV